MSKKEFNEPLHIAAAKSLRVAGRIAQAEAKAVNIPLVVWNDDIKIRSKKLGVKSENGGKKFIRVRKVKGKA